MAKPINLTAEWLRAKQAPDRYPVKGRRGMYAWVYPSGAKATYYRSSRFGWVHLADHPGTDLADAFAEYERIRKLVKAGVDPKAPIPTATTEETVEQTTFGDVAEAWYNSHCLGKVMNGAGQWVKHPNRTPLKAPEYKRLQLDTHLLPHWKDRPLAGPNRITLVDANRRLDQIVAAGSPVMANRVGATIEQIWRWAVSEGVIEASPMIGLTKRGGRETARERILNDDELKAFWTGLDTSGLSDVVIAALKLCLLTGCRRAEVAGAKWSEIHGDLWIIPPSRIKTEHRAEQPKPHFIPLSDMALAVLEPMRGRDKRAVFPSPAKGSLRPAALSRAVSRKQKHFGIAEFTPHDLRRTVRSKLASLGVSSVVAKKVLNHSLEGMDAVYDRYDYLDEKRDALQLWADHLRAIVEGKQPKVVPMRVQCG
ncbi:MAG TPA: tyrosine-type recombinase/integrase [Gammaproteobacteria bacterium]